MKFERGGFAMGLLAGLLIGLALALGVALYITKAPVPFVNKVHQRTAEQDTAETARNRDWDPNAALGVKGAARAASAAAAPSQVNTTTVQPATTTVQSATAAAPAAASAVTRAPSKAGAEPSASAAIAAIAATRSSAAGPEPFIYFVQAGAYTRNEEAEQQRARLAMLGHGARITEREQAGRTVYRVRAGPFPTRSEADAVHFKLQEQDIEAQIVRVEKP